MRVEFMAANALKAHLTEWENNALKTHLTEWEKLAAKAHTMGGGRKKAKREQRVSPAFRAALCWVTSQDPAAPFEERAKRAETISKVGKKNGFKMPKKNGRERRAAIWERRIMHKRAEEALDKLPNPRRSRYSSGYGYVVIGK